MKLEFEVTIEDLRDMVRVAAVAVAAAAVYHELQKPPEMRTWRGEVGGVVPYDFRRPTLERVMASYWNPVNESLFTRTPFGVGWAVNIPVLARQAGELFRDAAGRARERVMMRRGLG